MKKLLLLFAVLLGTVGAWAQEVVKIYRPTNRVSELKTDGTKYMIFNTTKLQGNRYGFVYNNGNGGLNKPVSTPTGFEALTNAYLFTLEASTTDGAYYIKSVSNNKYVNHQGATNNETPQDCYIYNFLESPYANTDANGQYMSKDDDATFIPYDELTEDQCLFTIGNKDGGDWSVWNGNEGSFGTWSTAHPYAFYEVEEAEESVTTTAITELANVSNDKLYIIKNARTANTALVYKNGGANVVWNGKDTSVNYDPRSNNFRWAIYKSSNNNYYLYNIGAGKYMGSAITKDAAIPFVDASGLHSVVIEESSANADYPFVMSTNNKKGALNTNASLQQGVVNWRDGYSKTDDAGNQFAFYEVADISNDVLTAIETAVTAYETNGVANWKNSHAASGYVGHYPLSTQDAYNAIASEADIDNFIYNNNVVALVDGYYFVKGTGTGNRDTWYLSHKVENDKECVWAVAPTGNLNADYIWKFETADGGYKIQSANVGKYFQLKTATNGGDNNTYIKNDFTDGDKFVVENKGMGKHLIKNADGKNIRTENGDASGAQVNYWSGESNESWYLIQATELDITIGEAGYATTHLPFDVTLPNTVKAYAVTETSASTATMTEMKDIPANTGAILEGQGTHTLTIAKASSDWTGNKLLGSNVATKITGPGYVLSKVDGVVALYAAALTDGKFLNNANKAYLPAAGNNARALVFSFGDDNATAIEGIEAENSADAVVFDLAGRRVQNAQKGVFIVNGKVVIK